MSVGKYRQTAFDDAPAGNGRDVMEIRQLPQQVLGEQVGLAHHQGLSLAALVMGDVVGGVGGIAYVLADRLNVSLAEGLDDELLRFAVLDAQTDQIIAVAQDLPGPRLVAGPGGDIRHGLRRHHDLETGPPGFVQYLDERHVDHFGGFVDEHGDAPGINAPVVNPAGHGCEVRQDDGTHRPGYHRIRQRVQPHVKHKFPADNLVGFEDVAHVPDIILVRRQHGTQRTGGQHVEQRDQGGNHLGKVEAVVLHQVDQAVDTLRTQSRTGVGLPVKHDGGQHVGLGDGLHRREFLLSGQHIEGLGIGPPVRVNLAAVRLDGADQQLFRPAFDVVAQFFQRGLDPGFDQALCDQVDGAERKRRECRRRAVGGQQRGQPRGQFGGPDKIAHRVQADRRGRKRRVEKNKLFGPPCPSAFPLHALHQILVALRVDHDDRVAPVDGLRHHDFIGPCFARTRRPDHEGVAFKGFERDGDLLFGPLVQPVYP